MADAGLILVTLDQEKIKRICQARGVDPVVTDLLLEMHDTTKTMERVVNEYAGQVGKIIEALALVNKGFQSYSSQLEQIKKRYNLDLSGVHTERDN